MDDQQQSDGPKPAADVVQTRARELQLAFELLRQSVDFTQANELCPLSKQAVFTTAVTLWMLVYQRMNQDQTLEAAVQLLIASQPDLLPQNKRVQGGLSTKTGTYSTARSRLPLRMVEWLANQVADSIIKPAATTFAGRPVYLIDGTTVTLAPEPVLRTAFPPATNQHGAGVWPVALLVMTHELGSGAALIPEIAPKFGDQAVSETALVERAIARLPTSAIVMADAGFGIFHVARTVHDSGRPFVFRLTQQRYLALRKPARLVQGHSRGDCHELTWRPSVDERRKHGFAADVAIEVRLIEVKVHDDLTVYLATTLPDAAAAIGELYHRRGEVEIDLRNFKVVLNAEHLAARSVDTFHKELLGSVIAYNLVTQFRKQAAIKANVEPRRLSFKRVWTTFRTFLLTECHTDPQRWEARYAEALHYASTAKLPHRPNRSYARETYTRREKSVQFAKRSPPK